MRISDCSSDVCSSDLLTLRNPAAMADLHQLNFDDIVDYLERLGNRLDPATNAHLQEASELARLTSGLSASVLRHQYESISHMLAPHVIRAIAAPTIGIAYLEGWVGQPCEIGSPSWWGRVVQYD